VCGAAVALSAVACTPHASSAGSETAPAASAEAGRPAAAPGEARAEAGARAQPSGPGSGDAAAEQATAEAEAEPAPSFDEVLAVLFADRAQTASIVAACPASLPRDARVRCLYDERYQGDPKAAGIAHELLVKWRTVAGVEVAHVMNGGYRGMIRIEPAVPVKENRKHLEWVAAAIRDFDTFFGELERSRVGAGRSVLFSPAGPSPKPYRFYPVTLRFMRSVAARTPAAYAHDWTVAYNFVGTLNVSADAVRETMFHEIFHLNDAAHGGWSPGALGAVFDAVAKKCGTSIRCLAPYTPNETIVRGGTYYSFQPGNGVMEYAAELALRYYREQRAVLRALPRVKPFKCGPPENERAWSLLRDEFFAGVDAVPPCP
jgi:hypothetical protein